MRSAYSIVHFCVDPGKRLHGERANKDHWFIPEQGAVLCTQHRKERPMTPSEWLAQHEWQPSPIPIADEQGNIISGCLIHAIAFAIPSVDEQADAIEALNRYCLQKYPHLKQVVQSAYVINYVDKTMLATKADAVALLRDAGL
ncbi:MAG: hypothetical protein KF693_02295 [Nitrospira sp.]|nr:hypothetical protein [Nitrospira sp.]